MSTSNGTTAVPPPSFTDAGFVAPPEPKILTGALADLNAALGGNLNQSLTTVQGQMATSFAAALGDAYAQILAVLNGVDPSRAFGRLQDAIGNIYFMSRKAWTYTTVTVTCYGAAQTPIPAGFLIQDKTGNYYAADSQIILSASGIGMGTFTCLTAGAIEVAANSVILYQALSGLTSVSNPAAGVTGSNEETRVEFEARRAASVAANSMGYNGAIFGAIMNVSGVTDAYVTDNSTSDAEIIGGVSIPANSLYVCVNGGSDTDIGTAIISKKPPGCGYSGTTSVTVKDPNPAYTNARSYSVSFTRAVDTAIYFQVTLKNSSGVPSSASQSVQDAILSVFSEDSGATIGGTIYSSAYYQAVAALGTWALIVEITVGTSSAPTTFTAAVNIDQIPTLDAANISVILS